MDKYRSGRINEEIKKELSLIIRDNLKDPRLTAMVSVTRVDVTRDLRYAKVYISLFGDDESKKNSLVALKSSSGFMRRELGSRINLRHTPELLIELDESLDHAMHIDSLIEKIKGDK